MGFLFQAVGMGNVDKKCLLVGAWMPLMGGLASPRTSRVRVCLLLSALFCVIRVRNAKGNTVRRESDEYSGNLTMSVYPKPYPSYRRLQEGSVIRHPMCSTCTSSTKGASPRESHARRIVKELHNGRQRRISLSCPVPPSLGPTGRVPTESVTQIFPYLFRAL